MARFIALDWDYQQLHLVAGTVKHGQLRIQQTLVRKEEQSPNLINAGELGLQLRGILDKEKIAPAPVLACVGRDRVIVKEIVYPRVSPAEEPAIIRFQAAKDLSHDPREVVIDYLPLASSSPTEARALVLVLRRELLIAVQDLCRGAGLKLAGLTPRPLGIVACAKGLPVSEPAAANALLVVAARWIEFCVVQNGNLLFARALATAETPSETDLIAEVRRNLAVRAAQAPEHPIRALHVAAAAPLIDSLRRALSIPVHVLDPFAGLEHAGEPAASCAGAVGLLRTQAEQRGQLINFVKPKEPRTPGSLARWRVAAAAILAGVVLVGGVVAAWSQFARREREIQSLTLMKLQVNQQLATLDEDAARLKAIDEWAAGEVNWLDELYDLTDRVPDVSKLQITQLTVAPRTAKDKHVALLTLKGITTNDPQQLDTLMSRLRQDGHYSPKLKDRSRNITSDQQRFPQQFTAEVLVEKVPPTSYIRRLASSPGRAAPGSEGGPQP